MEGEAGVRVVAVMGPTGGGKARLARAAAERTGAQLVSCDSMKVYRGLDVGTAKPAVEERGLWRAVDCVDPWERYDAQRFRQECDAVFSEARAAGRPVLLSGGTMLYMRAATEGLDAGLPRDDALRAELVEEATRLGDAALHARLAAVDPRAAQRIHPNDRRRVVRALEVYTLTGAALSDAQQSWGRVRPGIARRVFGVARARVDMDARIDARVDRMFEAGWLDECRRLRSEPRGLSREARQALGYRELFAWIEGGEREPLAEVRAAIKTHTRRFARKQLTWLRRLGDEVTWLETPPGGDSQLHLPALLEALGA
ncbi:MAG: tRNA (adenosine(37)-N6)-dimethylallyltransferase MiaA [Planctomycetes bacterium]|nr:tRNA (adenosine(37)-N6)-dimethylallyltransferase MiaA [Planctomycetota bacterium]